jgi:hypothetical protein
MIGNLREGFQRKTAPKGGENGTALVSSNPNE